MQKENPINNETITYFKIIGDFEPDDISKELCLNPCKTWKKGEKRKYLGRYTKGIYNFSLWEFGRIEKVNNVFVDEQMKDTIAPLFEKIDILNQLKQKYELTYVLEVVPKLYTVINKPILSPPKKVVEFCYLTETSIDMDYYLCFDVV